MNKTLMLTLTIQIKLPEHPVEEENLIAGTTIMDVIGAIYNDCDNVEVITQNKVEILSEN